MVRYDKQKQAEYLSFYNRDAFITHEGRVYAAKEKDFIQLNTRGNYWHTKTDPSSWLVMSAVKYFRKKFKKLPRSQVVALVARMLNVDAYRIESSLDWSAQYMAWHEGGEPDEYHILPPE
jgi:hypothetical protein